MKLIIPEVCVADEQRCLEKLQHIIDPVFPEFDEDYAIGYYMDTIQAD